jgi:hypothetical protein
VKIILGVAATAAAIVLCSCSSSSRPAHTSAPRPSPYAPATGADAALIAAHITGCSAVHAGDVGKGGPDLSSTATCTIDGHVLIIDSFATASGPNDVPQLVGKVQTYYAYGTTGWLAFLASADGAAHTQLQMQITNDAAGLLDQSLNGEPAPTDLDAQRQVATTVATALGGALGHAGTA